MSEYTGRGDPTLGMQLLWGVRGAPSRGPKPKLDVEAVVRGAIAVADTEGLPALSMRRVADELGVGVMSLYRYVPNKAQLIDVMLDRVCAETARPEQVEGGWRARLELIAREEWKLCLRHPWVLQVAASRPPLGPNVIAKYDYELRAVDGIGLSDLEMDAVVTLVSVFVHGVARGAVDAAAAPVRTGMSDLEWWEAHAPLLGQVLDADKYPLAVRVGAAAGEEYQAATAPERTFEFGLERLLDGVAALVDARGRA
ncbi:TetR/AcrR family transcriptional regulator [Motilibacter aurantiacus]|uniref:TetR/AcrR family transcriptional regulator n=1 Tax=Motilibacter aurantiacus TaxID=2714955 RepID=UPI00140C5D95|nr:TetR/AcrR family transcriptional regulator [Motilibacter aurantiacus]NHC46164.1 TetR/AcrR family transcriptional regulator [Motilibacter aurantiacus]